MKKTQKKIILILIIVALILTIGFLLHSLYSSAKKLPTKKQTTSSPTIQANNVSFLISGGSMNPTLSNGQNVIVDLNYYQNHNIARGDIVAINFEMEGQTKFVKRIIGLPGDKIIFGQDGKIYLNDKVLQENYLNDPNFQFNPNQLYALLVILEKNDNRIPEGKYLVLGDNRKYNISYQWGFIEKEYIFGKLVISN